MTLFGAPLRKWALTAAVVYGVVRSQKASQRALEELVDATMAEAIEHLKKAPANARGDAYRAADRLLTGYEKQRAPGVAEWRRKLDVYAED